MQKPIVELESDTHYLEWWKKSIRGLIKMTKNKKANKKWKRLPYFKLGKDFQFVL